jgi:CBS domain containing-hemolysin-like protein
LLSLLNGTANSIVRVFGIPAVKTGGQRGHPREIMTLVKQSHESGLLDTQDVRLFEGVLEFTEKTARDVMTPRTEVVALKADLTVEEAAARIAVEGRSRYPLIHGSLDDIVGVVHAKEVLTSIANAKYQRIEAIMQDALFVPGSREIEDLLGDMQRLKRHLAIVLDEYGGTAGIVTMEDLLEEIVGQIFDEYDEADAAVEPDENATTLPGHMEIDEANERFGFAIKSAHYTTVGGFVFGALGRLPRLGDRVQLKDATLEVIAMEERRIGTLRIWPEAPGAKERGRSERA